MNIIEAIKSGKCFKRKVHPQWIYHNTWDNEFYFYNGKKEIYFMNRLDTISDDWEVTEQFKFSVLIENLSKDIKKHEEIMANEKMELDQYKEITFDPTKPVQTRYGDKVRILCDNLKGDKPICAAVDMGLAENIGFYNADGKFNYKDGTSNPILDLINIPEPKPIDIHVGGIYKTKHGEIYICAINNEGTYMQGIVVSTNDDDDHGNNLMSVWKKNIIKHLGDIQDLTIYIKNKLTGEIK